jgi:hypothetical protein
VDAGSVWRAATNGACEHEGCRSGDARLACAAARLDAAVVARDLPPEVAALTLALREVRTVAIPTRPANARAARWAAWHGLGHLFNRDAGVWACTGVPATPACRAAWLAGIALAVPASAFDDPPERAARRLGLPLRAISTAEVLGRQHGERPGVASRDEIAAAWRVIAASPACRVPRVGAEPVEWSDVERLEHEVRWRAAQLREVLSPEQFRLAWELRDAEERLGLAERALAVRGRRVRSA